MYYLLVGSFLLSLSLCIYIYIDRYICIYLHDNGDKYLESKSEDEQQDRHMKGKYVSIVDVKCTHIYISIYQIETFTCHLILK